MKPYHATAITADGRRMEETIHAPSTRHAELTMASRATLHDAPPRYLSVRRAPTPASQAITQPAELTPPEPPRVIDGWLSDSALAALDEPNRVRSPAPRIPRITTTAPAPAPTGWRQSAITLARHLGGAWGVSRNLIEIYRHHRRGGCTRRRALRRTVMPLVNDVLDPVRITR